MKKMLSLSMVLLLVCMLAASAMAAPAPTGATPEEIALYSMQGPAAQGMPTFARENLGAARGNAFVAVKEDAAPFIKWGNVLLIAQQMADSEGIPLADALSLVLDFCYISYDPNRDNMKMHDYGVSGHYKLTSQDSARFYLYFVNDNVLNENKYDWGEISRGTGDFSEFMGMSAEFDWHPAMEIFVTLEKDDGTVLTQSNKVVLPKPAE